MRRKVIHNEDGDTKGWFDLDAAERLNATNYSRDGYIYERDLIVTARGILLWNPWSNVCGYNGDRYIICGNVKEVALWAVEHEQEDRLLERRPDIRSTLEAMQL